jgi:hypothetical protein
VLAADRFGTEIRVGSVVCYPLRQGSRLWVVDGVVVSIMVIPDGEGERVVLAVRDRAGKVTRTACIDRVTVLSHYFKEA